jgi:hypothetical protein
MSLRLSFNSSVFKKQKQGKDADGVFRDKHGRVIKHEEDFAIGKRRHADGSTRYYRNGKLVKIEEPDGSKFHHRAEVKAKEPDETRSNAHAKKRQHDEGPKRFGDTAPSMKL